MKFKHLFGTNKLTAREILSGRHMKDYKAGYLKGQQYAISHPDLNLVVSVFEKIARTSRQFDLFALGIADYYRDLQAGCVRSEVIA